MSTIRLMIVDDNDVVRAGLKSFLESQDGLIVVAEARTGEEAINISLETRRVFVILYIRMQ